MRQNIGYKLLALVLAIVLWAKVNSDRNPSYPTQIGKVNVVYTNLPKGMVATEAPKTIEVSATGPQSAVRSLDRSQIEAKVNLSDVEVGVNVVKVEFQVHKDMAENLTLAPNKPVEVRIEAFKRKSMTIDVSLEGVPPLGYSFGKASAYPSAAVVSGTGSLVDQVRRLTIKVSPGAAQSQGDDYYPVIALDTAGRQIKGLIIQPSTVSAKLELVEAQNTKSVIISASVVGQPAYPHKVESVAVTPSVATIFGRPNNLLDVSTITTDPVDISNATGTIVRTVGLKTPSAIRSTNIKTVKVVVTIGE
jgi:YbbR domain-containing protein